MLLKETKSMKLIMRLKLIIVENLLKMKTEIISLLKRQQKLMLA